MADELTPEQKQAAYTRQYGSIPESTVQDWKRMVTDESYDFHHRALIHRTAIEALAKIGKTFDVPEPTARTKQ